MYEQLRSDVAKRLKLPVEEVFSDQKLSEVLTASPEATNSIDLLDAFAGAIADQGLDEELDLPAFTLDHSVNDVISALEKQLASPGESFNSPLNTARGD